MTLFVHSDVRRFIKLKFSFRKRSYFRVSFLNKNWFEIENIKSNLDSLSYSLFDLLFS